METQVDNSQETKQEANQQQKEVDLVTKVSQVKVEEKKDDATFNLNDIEKIEDPQAKEYAQKAYKSLQGDYTRKYQALAEERKAWEAKKAESDNWTTDRVQSLLNDPKFVQAAQSVVTQGSQTDEYSALSDAEKKQIREAKEVANKALLQNAQLLKQQQYELLKNKYANFDANSMDILTAEILSQKRQIQYEDIWKSKDYDDAVKRAYELGRQDRKLENQEKATSMSIEGVTQQATEGAVDKKEGETDKQWFIRNALNRFTKSKEGQIKK